MKNQILKYLCCPSCKEHLNLSIYEVEQEEIISGVLKCIRSECGSWYPVIRGIPRLFSFDLRAELTNNFQSRFRNQLLLDGINLSSETHQKPYSRRFSMNDLQGLKLLTMKNFGFEWLQYGRFGWDDSIFNIEREKQVFIRKSLFSPEDFQGKLVLDAGCGNGRYSFWAAEFGGEVIGIELGNGVESAFRNTRMNNVHIVQGDLFSLPFRENIFDIIFSIGVLMHTGNPKQVMKSLIDHLAIGGKLAVHVYGKGNPLYELNDRLLRYLTTKMSILSLASFTKMMAYVALVLYKIRVLRFVNSLIRLENHPHCIFDWYSAPIATHHTESEAVSWFTEFDLEIVRVESGDWQGWNKKLGKILGANTFFAGSTITAQGRKRKSGGVKC
jgi:SAM-dependent methyltransferase/uncharacterized protein YbaR (Trm112 family)